MNHPEDPFDVFRANCSMDVWWSFHQGTEKKLWRVDALVLASAIMVGSIVGIDAYSQRYHHHPITRFIYLGATTLFLPIISSVVSSINTGFDYSMIIPDIWANKTPSLMAVCNTDKHSVLVVTWALLVQNVLINTSIVVAVDQREGRSTGPPVELLAQGVWILYLGISHIYILQATYPKENNPFSYTFGDFEVYQGGHPIRSHTLDFTLFYLLEVIPFVLTLAKLAFKFYAAKFAQQSFAFGRNPRLVSRYMQQLQPMSVSLPSLLVMGEESRHVEKHPCGYVLMDDDDNSDLRTMSSTSTQKQGINGLVTVDRVWQQLDGNNGTMLLPAPTAQRLKDLCISFALFKLLRCRFARYELADAVSGSDMKNTFGYFWSLLLNDSEQDDSVFRVIVYSLSFLHDYYYSSFPICYSKCWLHIVGIFISLSTIGYCIFLSVWMIQNKYIWKRHQIECVIRCEDAAPAVFGSLLVDVVPLFVLLVFVMTAELRDLAYYICSNWTKVVVTCRLLLQSDNQCLSMRVFKWSAYLLRCRCRRMKHHFWDERMGQCSVLPLHQGTKTPLALGRRLLRLPYQKAKLNPTVKVSIIDVLRSSRNDGRHLSNGRASLYRLRQQGGESFLWACDNKSTSDVILTWQIATNILEVRYPLSRKQSSSSNTSDRHRTVATQLSRYCVYLVTYCPELPPDDDAWSKSLYEDVKKDAERALARPCCARTHRCLMMSSASTPGYQELVDLLSANANSKHQVLNDGVKLGKQLVLETIYNEEAAWKLLVDFWSEMILYVAPSDNLKGHKESIARGGELITLLWALLGHAGIISRSTSDDDAGCAAGTS